jgi:cyclopropane-fatty-acyl-phospholipid synthase
MVMQAITISDHRYERALHRVDFIQKYIFPGSCIPSLTALSTAMSSNSDMRITHLEDITEDYATTLNLWQKEFIANKEKILKLGEYDADFIRLWKFYFSYCEGGFKERSINNIQVLYSKPANRRQRLLC